MMRGTEAFMDHKAFSGIEHTWDQFIMYKIYQRIRLAVWDTS